jgi:putative DNA primase/helicase
MVKIEKLITELDRNKLKPKLSGSEWQARCPIHNGDDYDSFTFRIGDDNSTLLGYCHTCGAKLPEIIEALGMTPEPIRQDASEASEEVFVYEDENSVPLFEVVKIKLENGKKDFYQRKPNNGERNLKGVRRVLYKLPELLANNDSTVFLCEGEKDVLKLLSLGLSATTCAGGALQKARQWKEEYTKTLEGKFVIILEDNDKAGRAHSKILTEVFEDSGIKSKLIRFESLPEHGDVSDWLNSGKSKDDLLALLNKKPRLKTLNAIDILNLNLPEQPKILDPIIAVQNLGMITGWRGGGKSQIGFSLSASLVTNTKWIKWSPAAPCNVVYADGEMSLHECYTRWTRWLTKTKTLPIGEFCLVTNEVQEEEGIKRLSSLAGQTELLEVIDATRAKNKYETVVIIDNLSCLLDGDENSTTDWDPMKNFLIQLRASGLTVIMFHHFGKGGIQRGTSKREDALNWSIILDGQEKSVECKFTMKWIKSRGLPYRDVEPVKLELASDSIGFEWKIVKDSEQLKEKILSLKNQGKSGKEIASELGTSEATVSRAQS